MTVKHFLACDLETTGLNEKHCAIVEVAAILLAGQERLGELSLVCCLPPDSMWSTEADKMHTASGLKENARVSSWSTHAADKMVRKMIDDNVPPTQDIYLLGHSVHFDRRFIDAHMPLTSERLHYRQLDVTSVSLWMEFMSGQAPKVAKGGAHRALQDAEEAISNAHRLWDQAGALSKESRSGSDFVGAINLGG